MRSKDISSQEDNPPVNRLDTSSHEDKSSGNGEGTSSNEEKPSVNVMNTSSVSDEDSNPKAKKGKMGMNEIKNYLALCTHCVSTVLLIRNHITFNMFCSS